MAEEVKHINLLVLESCSDNAEQLFNKLRRAGYKISGAQIANKSELKAALAEKQSWDIILGKTPLEELSIDEALQIVDEHGRDIPLISISEKCDEETIVHMLSSGAQDHVSLDNNQHLTLAVQLSLIHI